MHHVCTDSVPASVTSTAITDVKVQKGKKHEAENCHLAPRLSVWSCACAPPYDFSRVALTT